MKKIIIVVSFIIIVIVSLLLLNANGIIHINKLKNMEQTMEESNLEDGVYYKIYSRESINYKVLCTIKDARGIKSLEFEDGLIINCNNKEKVSKDMEMEPFKEYKVNVIFQNNEKETKILSITDLNQEFEYTGDIQAYYVAKDGYYKLEATGASGGTGYGNVNPYGEGGYTEGTTYLKRGQILYVYVGQAGIGQTPSVTFNGGGSAFTGEIVHKGGQGGGATDFRLTSGNWNNMESLKSRILVAGGGGGAQSSCGGNNTTAGHGGGLAGIESRNISGYYAGHIAYGGNQISGGSFVYGSNAYRNGVRGQFGIGASANTCASGGGGGYYGGASVYTAGGGGGSSFVTGYDGCDTTYRNLHIGIDGQLVNFRKCYYEAGTVIRGMVQQE